MDTDGLKCFLSDGNIALHLEYTEAERARLSVMLKVNPHLNGKDRNRLLRVKEGRAVAEKMLNVRLHELYFDSFRGVVSPSPLVRRFWRSEDNLLYEGELLVRAVSPLFAYIYVDQRGMPRWCAVTDLNERIYNDPVLVIDTCEHAYYGDYGFDRDRYVRRAFSAIDLSRLDKMSLNSK